MSFKAPVLGNALTGSPTLGSTSLRTYLVGFVLGIPTQWTIQLEGLRSSICLKTPEAHGVF